MRTTLIFIAIRLFCLFFLFVFTPAPAQDFTTYNANLPGVAQGAASWGDMDQDGYLDVVLTGMNASSQPMSRLFRNNAGVFQEINAGLSPLKNGTVQFGDYDNDGDLDILLCGLDPSSSAYTYVYRNDNGTFTKCGHGIVGVYNGVALFADFNNDGFLDILVSGDTLSYSPVTRIYLNKGDDSFAPEEYGLAPAISSSAAVADYDNDGDVDILLSGDIGGAYYTKLYRNDNALFAEVPVMLEGVGAGWSRFLDFDKDGDNDILLMGNDLSLTPTFKIYRNDGNNVFSEVFAGVTGLSLGSIDIADYDNDGFTDFVATGRAPGCGAIATVLFRNNQNGNFWQAGVSLINLSYSHASWADFDNDGDSDLLLMGASSSGLPTTRLYQNNLFTGGFTPHLSPSAPTGLEADVAGEDVILKWHPVESKNQGKVYSYNLRVGISSGSSEIMAPLSDPASGYLRFPDMGNTTQDTFWILKNLRESDYFWSVQAVDASFGGSFFSPEETFTISLTGIGNNPVIQARVYPNPFASFLLVEFPQGGTYARTSLQGSELMKGNCDSRTLRLETHNLPKGIYFLTLSDGIHSKVFRLVK